MIYKITLSLAIILAFACNRPVSKTATSSTDSSATTVNKTGSVWFYIQQKRWKLIQLQGKMQEQSNVWLEFDTVAQRFSGNGGCNKIAGSYSVKGEDISFQKVMSTRMACIDQAANEREVLVTKLLTDQTYRFDVADQTLQFYRNDSIVMMFGASPKDEK